MGEARVVMDGVTDAMLGGRVAALRELYAEDAIAETPDVGELHGRDAIVDYLREFAEVFPDARYASSAKYEVDGVAIDEGHFEGTNTGPLKVPGGETLPATGRRIRVRGCDIATVADGRITSHHFYFDQLEMLSQLGLVPEQQAART